MRMLKRFVPLLGVFLFSAALWVLHKEISVVSLKDLRAALTSVSIWVCRDFRGPPCATGFTPPSEPRHCK